MNESLTPGIHVEPDGLAWWQESSGLIVIGEEVVGRADVKIRPLAKIQVPHEKMDIDSDEKMWSAVREWVKTHGPKLGFKRST